MCSIPQPRVVLLADTSVRASTHTWWMNGGSFNEADILAESVNALSEDTLKDALTAISPQR